MALKLGPTLLAPWDAEPADLAEWYLKFGKPLESEIRRVKDRLIAHMSENGDLPGLGLSYRYEWAPDAAAEFPDLVREWALRASLADIQAYQRLLDLVLEQVPDAVVKQESKIDGRRANQVILRGGKDGHRLQELRVAVPRLVTK